MSVGTMKDYDRKHQVRDLHVFSEESERHNAFKHDFGPDENIIGGQVLE
jgi:hypothetical protein